MKQDRESDNMSSKTLEPATIPRRAFLAETVAMSAAVSALLDKSSSVLAEPKDEGTSSTADRLQAQFSEVAGVAATYAAFAAQAQAEHRPQVASLFQALVIAETFHAEWVLRQMNALFSTADNLKAGAEREALLADKVLPAAAAQARQEKENKAGALFEKLAGACTIHEKVLRQARERLLAGRDADPFPIRICPDCGSVFIGTIPDKCPICSASSDRFIDAP